MGGSVLLFLWHNGGVVTAFAGTDTVVWGGVDLTAWPLVGLDILVKNPTNGDVLAIGFAVYSFLAIAYVAAGGNFVFPYGHWHRLGDQQLVEEG